VPIDLDQVRTNRYTITLILHATINVLPVPNKHFAIQED